ncbi:MAG: deoxyribodipyrimidine photo-lyase [Rhodopila sp.]
MAVLSDLVSETGTADVFTGGLAEPRARREDQAVAEALGDRGARLQRMRTTTLFNPDSIRTKAGGAYGVYTPFANACLALGGPKPPLPAPRALRAAAPVRSDRLKDWQLLPTKPDWASACAKPGLPASRARWNAPKASSGTGSPPTPPRVIGRPTTAPRCCRRTCISVKSRSCSSGTWRTGAPAAKVGRS